MTAVVISDARIAAAHDGVAELVVTLRHDNGGCSRVALDAVATAALMRSCNAQCVEELTGQSWTRVREALSASWNRFADESEGG